MAALDPPWPVAVAVSGGGDSTALMLLLAGWAKSSGKTLPTVLCVDHGLRKESRKQAAETVESARTAGLDARVLVWKGPKPASDIEAEARRARYALMGQWCVEHGVPALYAGHTLEDQAETFLLRLGRGSGLDGLCAMQPVGRIPIPAFASVALVRPLLEFGREELRAFLKARKTRWLEDPMNADPRFTRGRLRAAWPELEALGLSPARIADAARHLSRARVAFERQIEDFLARAAKLEDGKALLDPVRLRMLPRELGLRTLAAVLSRVSGDSIRPRFESLERLFDSILSGTLGGGATLHGCTIAPASARDRVFGSATLTFLREPGRNYKRTCGNRRPPFGVELI